MIFSKAIDLFNRTFVLFLPRIVLAKAFAGVRAWRPANPNWVQQGDGWAGLRASFRLVQGLSREEEVIRETLLYVWAAVSSFRRCDSCGTRGCKAAREGRFRASRTTAESTTARARSSKDRALLFWQVRPQPKT